MHTTVRIALCLIAWGFMVIGWALMWAPEGYEDETGFHYGKPQQKDQ